MTARYQKGIHLEVIEGQEIEVGYSEFIFGRKSYSDRIGITEQRLRTLVKKMVDDNMIQLVGTYRKCSVYAILNYSKYNMFDGGEQPAEQPAEQRQTNQQSNQQSNQQKPATSKGFEGFATAEQPAEQRDINQQANVQSTTYKKKEKNVIKDIKNKEIKKEYSENVFLTESEYIKLTELMGEDKRDSYFLRYGSWISGKPVKEQERRSAYLSIRSWYNDEKQKGAAEIVRTANREVAATDDKYARYDFGF
jgi:hypothetical protein